MSIIDFLLGRRGRRDGSSPERAILVASVAEQYAFLKHHYPRFKLEEQTLHRIDGNPYDVLAIFDDSGQKKKIYFDISQFFGK